MKSKITVPDLETHNARERAAAPEAYGQWMRVNCVIDPRDEIFRFFANHASAGNPYREYLSDGWRTLSELMRFLEELGRPLVHTGSMLEFAAGFGRFTRHLAPILGDRLTCSDVQLGSADFLAREFGVKSFFSNHDPARVAIPGRHELVFVLSMFTHIPPAMWAPWLRALHAAVAPGGHLVFSVHNERWSREQGVPLGADGTHFITDSESRSLTPETYGTTFTTREFVERTIRQALGREVAAYREITFWDGQDAVAVAA